MSEIGISESHEIYVIPLKLDVGKYKLVIFVPDEVRDAQPDVEVLVLHLLQ